MKPSDSTRGAILALVCAATPAQARQWSAVRMHPDGYLESRILAVSPTAQGGQASTFPPMQRRPALLWFGSPNSTLSIDPDGLIRTIDGDWQAGESGIYPYLWHGTASAVPLLAPGTRGGSVFAMKGGLQAGNSFPGDSSYPHAGIWRGTAASWVDLHPATAIGSSALATDGVLQGGTVQYPGGTGQIHAALWSGTAASFIDMNPPGARYSEIDGMVPGQQVGKYETTTISHAIMWFGSATSFVDMNPPRALGSQIYATCGTVQVGEAALPDHLAHAWLWFGSPDNCVDLSSFLPEGSGQSWAYAVAQDGDRIIVGGEVVSPLGHYEAFMWVGTIPEPSTLGVLALGLLATRRRRL